MEFVMENSDKGLLAFNKTDLTIKMINMTELIIFV